MPAANDQETRLPASHPVTMCRVDLFTVTPTLTGSVCKAGTMHYRKEFDHLAHIIPISIFIQPSVHVRPSLPSPALLPARLYLSFKLSAVERRVLAPAGSSAGVASVLRAEALNMALLQGTDSTVITTAVHIY